MAEQVGTVQLNLEVNSKNVKQQIKQTAKTTEKTMGQCMASVGKVIASAFAISQIVNFTKACTQAYQIQVQNETKLKTIMKQRMNVTNAEIESTKKLITAQQQLGVIGDEVQMGGAQQLATFLNTKKALDILIPAMNNLGAQQMGYEVTAEGMRSLGNMIGKVMQGEVGALKEAGITFLKAEENALKYGDEIQRATTLSQVITNNVGRMNEILARTPTGKQIQLANAWGDLKEELGGIVTNIISPIVGWLSVVVQKLTTAIAKAREFTETIFNIPGAEAIQNIGQGAENTASNIEAVTTASKAAQKQLMGFDSMNILNAQEEGTTAETNTGSSMKETASEAQKATKNTQYMNDELITCKQYINDIKGNFEALGTSMLNTGKIIGECLYFGAKTFFSENIGKIKENIQTMLSIIFDTSLTQRQLGEAIQNIFSVFKNEEATQAVANCFTIIYEQINGIYTIAMKVGRDFLNTLIKPIVENQGKFKECLQVLLDIASPIIETMKKFIVGMWQHIQETYDKYVKPTWDNITESLSNICSKTMDTWLTYIAPLFAEIGQDVIKIWNEYIKPVCEKLIDICGKIIEIIGLIIKTLEPLITYIQSKVAPIIATVLAKIWENLKNTITLMLQMLDNLLTGLNGILDFIAGIFTGDWERAWNGIKNIFKSVWDSMVLIIKTPINTIIKMINTLIRAMNKISFEIPEWAPGDMAGKRFGFNLKEIPQLANGGYFKANQPQLAIVGDNKTQGEIVAPENKIIEAVTKAMMNTQKDETINMTVQIGDDVIIQKILQGIKKEQRRNGSIIFNV